MVIHSREWGYGRGQLVTLYTRPNEAVPVAVTPDSVSISVDDTYRVTLSKIEMDAIFRATYGIDWEKPE